MYGIIYKAAGPGGKVYIGQTTQNLKRRKGKHKFRSLKMDVRTAFQRAILEHGFDSFTWEEIDRADTAEELDAKEKRWIAHYRSNEPEHGYNMQNGGKVLCGEDNPNFGKHHSEESKRKMSEAHKNMSEETRRKLSKAQRGKVMPPEAREKMSEAAKGNKNFLGKHHSEETRRKRGEAAKGRPGPMTGKHPTEETRRKMSEAAKGRRHTEESRRKMSEAAKRRQKKTEKEAL
jgi:group I intron endonuclease